MQSLPTVMDSQMVAHVIASLSQEQSSRAVHCFFLPSRLSHVIGGAEGGGEGGADGGRAGEGEGGDEGGEEGGSAGDGDGGDDGGDDGGSAGGGDGDADGGGGENSNQHCFFSPPRFCQTQ